MTPRSADETAAPSPGFSSAELSPAHVWGTSAEPPAGPIDPPPNPADVEPTYPGGWGRPGAVTTGPIPRLGRGREKGPERSDPADKADAPDTPVDSSHPPVTGPSLDKAAGGATITERRSHPASIDPSDTGGLPAVSEPSTMWHITDAHFNGHAQGVTSSSSSSRFGAGSPTRGTDPLGYAAQPVEDGGQQAADEARGRSDHLVGQEVGIWGLTDVTFRVRATRALTPVTYLAALVLFLGLYVSRVYTVAMQAALAGEGLGEVVVTITLGLAAVIAATAGTRLLLEFFCNVADLSRSRRR